MSFNSVYGGFTGLPGDGGGGSPSGPAGGDLTGTYPDPTIAVNAVTFAKFQQATLGTSVIARSAASTGDFAELQATSDGQILIRQAGTLVFASGSGVFLPLAGGTMSGDIAMGNNDITGCNSISGTDGNYDLNQNTIRSGGIIAMDFFFRRGINSSGSTTFDWEARTFSSVWRANANFELASNLLINDSLSYKTALSVPSVGVLGIGAVGSEFTSYDFGSSSRNYIRISNAASASSPTIEGFGVDAAIGINYVTKGSGQHVFSGNITLGTTTSITVSGGTNFRSNSGNIRTLEITRSNSLNIASTEYEQLRLSGTYTAGSGAGYWRLLNANPTLNTSGTNTVTFADFDPTITLFGGTLIGIRIRPATALNGFGLDTALPTAVIDLAESTTSRASLRIRSGVSPTSPNDGDLSYITTNNRLLFRRSATNVEILAASAVTTEVVVSDTTLTIQYNGVTYKLLARA